MTTREQEQFIRGCMTSELKEEIIKASDGKISEMDSSRYAADTVKRLDLDNPYQMHKSMKGYARMIVDSLMPAQV